MKYYTGVGSRKTPKNVLTLMTNLAKFYASQDYILRSGGAYGADQAFEQGARQSDLSLPDIYLAKHCTSEAMDIAKKFHPAWNRCSMIARKLHGRNSFQVLGRTLNNLSEFLICWTPDGCKRHKDRTIKTGGTGTAISIAAYYDVKIYNLQNKQDFNYLSELII